MAAEPTARQDRESGRLGQVAAQFSRRAGLQRWGNGAPHWWRLVALSAGLNLAETALVAGFGQGSHPNLAPQASAIAPFGLFGDLRWVSVYHDSWVTLVAEVLAMVIARGTLTSVSISLAWPGNLARPSRAQLMRRGTFATALAALMLWPSVALLYGLAALPVSWLFLAAVPTALLVAFVVHPAAVSADWWRRGIAPRALWWVCAAFLTLTMSSAVMAASPSALWPVVAVLSGLFNAWSWVGLVHAVADRQPARHLVPVTVLTALALAGLVVGGAVAGFRMAHKPIRRQTAEALLPARQSEPAASRAVLVVSGYGSSWSGQPFHAFAGNFLERRFSYKGLGRNGEPLPYSSADTAKPLVQLDRMLLSQVAALRNLTGRTVDVVAESEGALVAKTALLAEPGVGVNMLILASPLEDPGRVWYPPRGQEGWGVASDQGMRLISDAFQGVAPIDLSPDNPLFASVDDEAPVLENAMACPISGVRQWALLPLADATVTPATEQLAFPYVVLPAFHGGLLETRSGRQVVARLLQGDAVHRDKLLAVAERAISYAASAWQVPPLAASDYPAPEAASCRQVGADLREALIGHWRPKGSA